MSDVLSGRLPRKGEVAGGSSVVLRWADVDPVAGAGGLAPALLKGLARLDAGARIRLTVTGGIDAPGWLSQRVGTVPVVHPGTERLLGRSALWWHPDYTAAWASLQSRLGALVDGDARVAEVTLGAPQARTGDPFARWAGLALNRAAYISAGWDPESDWSATAAMIDAQLAAWPTTTATLWVASWEAMSLAGVRSHMEPVLALAESVAAQAPDRLLLGAARRLRPSAGFAGPLGRLSGATGPRAAVSAPGPEGTGGWDAVYHDAGVALTSVEHP